MTADIKYLLFEATVDQGATKKQKGEKIIKTTEE